MSMFSSSFFTSPLSSSRPDTQDQTFEPLTLVHIFLRSFFQNKVIRVISAVFLSQTLEAANNDAEMMIQERMRKKAAFVQKLEGQHAFTYCTALLNMF